tara:strand:+ start:1051365 stop:1051697 length:333 start_codon:yes stop_codon:yes gene_type:complete
MPLPRHRLLAILDECNGDDLWSIEQCNLRRVPQDWIDELADTFESGFKTDSQTIYEHHAVTNHYRGVRDVDLARRAAAEMGMNVDRITASAFTRRGVVQAIKQAIMDGDD